MGVRLLRRTMDPSSGRDAHESQLLKAALGSISLLLPSSMAFAQISPGSTTTVFSNTSLIPLWAALIGAASALVTAILKDHFFQIIQQRRSKRMSEVEIYRHYLAPLCAASEKLVWRFKEIFVDRRHQFLLSSTLPVDYNKYKRTSTLYRIASVMGWIRAMTLEINALPRGRSSFDTPVAEPISSFQSALADGPHVEVHRLEHVASIWNIDLQSVAESDKVRLATKLEVQMYNISGDELKRDPEHLKIATIEEKQRVCSKLADFLCSSLGRKRLEQNLITETINQVVNGLSCREALIYRDWQDAIGDSMLERDADSVRRFKIVGYQKFEELLQQHTPWMEVFSKSIVDIDFDEIDPSDFRSRQLRDVARAVSGMLIAVANSKDADLIGEATLEVARYLALSPTDGAEMP